jgi:hypothetical protein
MYMPIVVFLAKILQGDMVRDVVRMPVWCPTMPQWFMECEMVQRSEHACHQLSQSTYSFTQIDVLILFIHQFQLHSHHNVGLGFD